MATPTRKRPDQRNRPEFREALGGAQTLPAGDLSLVTPWAARVILLLLLVALLAITALSLSARLSTPNAASVAPGSITMPATFDSARATQARSLANPPGVYVPVGQKFATAPVAGAANSANDAYALQGSVGTAATR